MGFVVDAVEGVFDAVGDVVSGVADFVGNQIESFVNDPWSYIETAALIAVGVPPPIASAATTALNGGDVGDILKSAASSYVTQQVGQEFGKYFGEDISALAKQYNLSPEQTQSLISASSRIVAGTAGGLASGRGLEQSLISGVGGAAGGYASDQLFPGTANVSTGKIDYSTGEKIGRALTSSTISTGVSQLFSPSKGGVGATSYSPTSSSQGPGASSAALSQALRTGDPGAPLFGTEGKEGQRKNVWNTASLKLKDETGT